MAKKRYISPDTNWLNTHIYQMEMAAETYDNDRLLDRASESVSVSDEAYKELKRTQTALAAYAKEYAERKRLRWEVAMDVAYQIAKRNSLLDHRIYVARKSLDGTLQADERRAGIKADLDFEAAQAVAAVSSSKEDAASSGFGEF